MNECFENFSKLELVNVICQIVLKCTVDKKWNLSV